jgi:hypothetical protein
MALYVLFRNLVAVTPPRWVALASAAPGLSTWAGALKATLWQINSLSLGNARMSWVQLDHFFLRN